MEQELAIADTRSPEQRRRNRQSAKTQNTGSERKLRKANLPPSIGVMALFELARDDGQIRVVEERHYKLVLASDLEQNAVRDYLPNA